MPRPKAPTAEETREELEAEGTYVSPTRAGSVEPPLMNEDPNQAAILEDIAAVWKDELTPESEADLIAFKRSELAAAQALFAPRNRGLHAKLAEVMLEVGRIPKNGTAPAAMGGYRFVQVGDAAEPIRHALASRGITCMPQQITEVGIQTGGGRNNNMTTQTIEIVWRLTDSETGEFYDLPSLGTGADSGDKFSPKAQTNAMKYMMLMGFLLPTGDDPEAADLSEPTQGGPINITGSNIEGVRAGGRQSDVTQAQLDAIRRRARELNLSPEAMTALIGSTLAGKAPDLDNLETLDEQQRAVLGFLGELSFDEAGSVVRAINDIPTPTDDPNPA